jgi:hypothetical protein
MVVITRSGDCAVAGHDLAVERVRHPPEPCASADVGRTVMKFRRSATYQRMITDDWLWPAAAAVVAVAFLLVVVLNGSVFGTAESSDERPPVGPADERQSIDDEPAPTSDEWMTGYTRGGALGSTTRAPGPSGGAEGATGQITASAESSPATTAASSESVAPAGSSVPPPPSTGGTSALAVPTDPARAPVTPSAPPPSTTSATTAPTPTISPSTTSAPLPPPAPATTATPAPPTTADPEPSPTAPTTSEARSGGRPADWVPPGQARKEPQP